MSNPRYWWWSGVKAAIRQYPALRDAKAELLSMQITSAPDRSAVRSNGTNRTVERVALQELSPAEEKVLDAVRTAIEVTELQAGGADHVRLIACYYWGAMSLAESARRCYIDERTAKRWNGAFVRLVARGMGYLSEQQDAK